MSYRHVWLSLLLLFAVPAYAGQEYSSIVNVDVTDVNAAAAKEKAMLQANRQALNNVAPLLATQSGVDLINSLSNEQIAYFIKDATVLEEKSSDVRYMASLKITIQDGILRQYLEEKGVAEELPSETIDVLYVFPTLSAWLQIERKLKSISNVEKIETIAMSNDKVQFKINYLGSFDDLSRNLSVDGYSLRDNGGIYILQHLDSSYTLTGEYDG